MAIKMKSILIIQRLAAKIVLLLNEVGRSQFSTTVIADYSDTINPKPLEVSPSDSVIYSFFRLMDPVIAGFGRLARLL